MKKFYVTTAIAYVNAEPHLGYAYEIIAADTIARYYRQRGVSTFFLTGTDEHSQNVEKKAKEKNIPPLLYCNHMVALYKSAWETFNISNDDFIQTSQQRHIKATQIFIEKLFKSKDIYKGKYSGWYCVSCESFLSDADIIEGNCTVHKKPVEKLEEENYFFSLSRYNGKLLKYFNDNPEFIAPKPKFNEVMKILEGGLQDTSISRSTTGWGIPFPGDSSHVVYVWLDALINYLSGIGYGYDEEKFKKYWPSDVHIIGKDIIRFHCLLWPALLMSVGLETPKKVFVHGFLNFGGEKMSKTSGNILSPQEAAKTFGVDPLRYFLLREIPFGLDGDFSEESFWKRYNSDLANDLGNLLHRTVAMIEKHSQGIVPESVNNCHMKQIAEKLPSKIDEHIAEIDFGAAIKDIWELVESANKYVETSRPWALSKEGKKQELGACMANLAQSLEIIALALCPFIPDTSKKIFEQIGLKDLPQTLPEQWNRWEGIKGNIKVKTGKPIFPRKE
ncbi:methionine--tRNA ligase [bacterium Unc6]|nr:methionine--tRNA ligase [bacterium Unc6]